jgi:hypothetical protein
MQAVWKMLYKNRCKDFDKYGEIAGNNNMLSWLYTHTRVALELSEEKRPTRVEESKNYQNIASKAREFAKLLESSNLDKRIHYYMTDEAVGTMFRSVIKAEYIIGHYCAITDEDKFNFKGAIHYVGCVNTFVANDTKQWFSRDLMPYNSPKMSMALELLASEADAYADFVKVEDRITERTSNKTTVFIRVLYANFWLNTFGTPLYRTFANYCSVALGDYDISESTIRDALKDFKYKHSPL